MYQFNEQFTNSYSQMADVAASANRLALENAQKAFGLYAAAMEETAAATFAYMGELVDVRDAEGLKAVWPKGVQVARESIERSVGTSQEVFGRTVKTNEAIAQIAKGEMEQVAAKAQAEADKVVKTAAKKARR